MPLHLPEYLEKDEQEKLLARFSKRYPTGIRDKAIVVLMLEAGLRVSEVCNLKPNHILWDKGLIFVKDGKGEKDRYVPVHRVCLEVLDKWDAIRPESEWFFCGIRTYGKQLKPRAINHMLAIKSKRAGIRHVHAHMLRHTCATNLIDRGYSLEQVGKILGHANPQNTAIYAKVRPRVLAEAIQSEERSPYA